MKDFFQQRWILIGVLAIFIILKLPHLSYPFYWDESWPYASGIYRMYMHGPSLLPGSIPGEVSRGHPLLFHFLAACWMLIFGTSHFALHCYALFVSICLLIAVHETGLQMFNRKVGILAVILIAFQQCFFVQSGFLLLEIQLALLAFLSIWFYCRDKFLFTCLSLTALFYTKESGMVAGVVLGIDAVIKLFNNKEILKSRLFRLLSVSIPVLLIAVFFILQKRINGWYVLPLYSGGLDSSLDSICGKIIASFDIIFFHDQRKWIFILLSFFAAIAAIKQKKYASLLLWVPIYLIGINHYKPGIMPPYLLVTLAFISIYYCVYRAFIASRPEMQIQKKFVSLLLLIIICFIFFTAINLFFIERYLFIVIIPCLFISAIFFDEFIKHTHRYALFGVILSILIVEAYGYTKDRWHSDMKLDAFNGMYVQKKVITYLEQHKLHNSVISTDAFLQRTHLTDKYSGFLDGQDTFTHVTWDYKVKPEYILIDNIEPNVVFEQLAGNDSFYTRVYKVEKGTAWAEIYKRK